MVASIVMGVRVCACGTIYISSSILSNDELNVIMRCENTTNYLRIIATFAVRQGNGFADVYFMILRIEAFW